MYKIILEEFLLKRKEGFFKGILYLMSSQVIIKLLGMVYTLYLTNKKGFGDEGNAICMAGFQVYALLLGLCAIGVPNAVSKLVAENFEVGNYENCNKILKISLIIFTTLGFFFCLFLYFFSDLIANNILAISESGQILKILAPSIVFSTVENVFRGYFNGIKKISISAKSAGLEQVLKTLLTIIVVNEIGKMTNFDTILMAKGAMLSASIATISSFLYSYIKYKNIKFVKNRNQKENKKCIKKILKELFSILIPISLTTALLIFENNIDSITIVRILKEKIGEKEAQKIYGIITSKVNLIVGLPLAINSAISVSLIPEISRNVAKEDKKRLRRNIKYSTLITLGICVPIMIVVFFFPKQIMLLLFPNAPKGDELLKLASITIVISCLTQNISGILQGVGDSKTHLYAVFWGMLVKLFLNVFLISNEMILEKGAIISTIIADFLIFYIMFCKFRKSLKFT